MASTEVEIRDNRELRRVEALDPGGEVAGFVDYQISVDGRTFDFTHAEVDDRFAGQGVGTRLAAGVIDFARAEDIKIVPSCSFVRNYMDEHEETADLRAERDSDESDDPEEDSDDPDDSGEGADEDAPEKQS
jgi:uncharacterized protein